MKLTVFMKIYGKKTPKIKMINMQNGVFEHFAHCILLLVLLNVFIYLFV